MSGLYGSGLYGVGPYGKAIEVPFKAAGSASSSFGGAARPRIRTGYRGTVAAFRFSSQLHTTISLKAAGFTGTSRTAGKARWTLSVRLRPLPAPWTCRGAAYWVLDPGDDETLHTKAASWTMAGAIHFRQSLRAIGWRAAARAAGTTRPNVQVQARGWRGSSRSDGRIRPLLFQSIDVLPAGSRFDAGPPHLRIGYSLLKLRIGSRFDGSARLRTRVAVKARGATRFAGRTKFTARFRGTFGPAGMRFAARGAISYSWSDLTAPGRNPLDPWGGVPDAGGTWSPAPTPADPWTPVAAPADPWITVPDAGKNWRDAE